MGYSGCTGEIVVSFNIYEKVQKALMMASTQEKTSVTQFPPGRLRISIERISQWIIEVNQEIWKYVYNKNSIRLLSDIYKTIFITVVKIFEW